MTNSDVLSLHDAKHALRDAMKNLHDATNDAHEEVQFDGQPLSEKTEERLARLLDLKERLLKVEVNST